jgi:VanZ family protein
VAAGASRLRLWAPVAVWMAVIFLASSRPVPAAASGVPDWIPHTVEYAVLAVLACRAMAGGLHAPVGPAVAAGAVALAFLYGVSDEIHQSFVPGRSPEAADLVKDLAGAVLGAGACALPRRDGARRREAA